VGVCVCLVGGELGADLPGVGVVEVVQDVQGLMPGGAGGGQVAGGAVRVAQVVQHGGLGVGFAVFLVQGHGLPVAGDGTVVLARAWSWRLSQMKALPMPS
jgi:hypothetical protein